MYIQLYLQHKYYIYTQIYVVLVHITYIIYAHHTYIYIALCVAMVHATEHHQPPGLDFVGGFGTSLADLMAEITLFSNIFVAYFGSTRIQ